MINDHGVCSLMPYWQAQATRDCKWALNSRREQSIAALNLSLVYHLRNEVTSCDLKDQLGILHLQVLLEINIRLLLGKHDFFNIV